MIAELSHYALVLAFALALLQSTIPIWGAAKNDATLMGVGEPVALVNLAFVGFAFAGLISLYVDVGLLRRQRLREFAFREAAAL